VVSPNNNKRVPQEVLMQLASIVMGYVTGGVPFTVPIVLGLAIGVFRLNEIQWRPSKSWVRKFLCRLGLSFRRATKTAQQLPMDFESVKSLFLLRFVFVVMKYSISKDLVINLDETGMIFFPMPDRSWAVKGAENVSLLGADEKRQFTVIPAITATGQLLKKVQVIWEGKTTRCEPSGAIKQEFPQLAHAHTESHWSSPVTKEAYIDLIYETYAKERVVERQSYWLLLLDVHYSNRDKEMLSRLRAKYPSLLILFVPANCTSELQPMDVSFNAPFKKLVRSSAVTWIADTIAAAGAGNEIAPIDTTKGNLVRPFCGWLHEALLKMADDAPTLSRAWNMPGLSVAWDAAKNTGLLAQAMQAQQEGKLWDFSVKEHPLLRSNEVDDEKESGEVEMNDDEHDVRMHNDSDDDEKEEEDLSTTFDHVPERFLRDLGEQLAAVVISVGRGAWLS
jgi:hypothetical protein